MQGLRTPAVPAARMNSAARRRAFRHVTQTLAVSASRPCAIPGEGAQRMLVQREWQGSRELSAGRVVDRGDSEQRLAGKLIRQSGGLSTIVTARNCNHTSPIGIASNGRRCRRRHHGFLLATAAMWPIARQVASRQLGGSVFKQASLTRTQRSDALLRRQVEHFVPAARRRHAWRVNQRDNEWQYHSCAALYRSSR